MRGSVKIGAVYCVSVTRLSSRFMRISIGNGKHNSVYKPDRFAFFMRKRKRLDVFDNIRTRADHVGVANDNG